MEHTKETNRDMNYISWLGRAVLLVFLDVLIMVVAYGFALLIRFDFSIAGVEAQYVNGYCWSIAYWSAITVVIFYSQKLYHSIWKFASMPELIQMVKAYLLLIPCYVAGGWVMQLHMPRSYYVIGYILAFIGHVAVRFSYRFGRAYYKRHQLKNESGIRQRILIIGAGNAGLVLIREFLNSDRLEEEVCCVIDDNPDLRDRLIEGVPVVGNRYDIPAKVKEYQINRIIFAIPTCEEKDRKEILNLCKECGCVLQTVPGVYQLVNGEVSIQKLRNVEIQDLLGRAQIQVNDKEVFHSLTGKRILVTGGGGSIGSELCRQIAANQPEQLIIFDMYENNAYDIQQELKHDYPELALVVLIGSVRNTNRIQSVMQTYKPDIVFHAAAHKHVPLMEDSPNEAIKNNVMGTYKTALAAGKAGVKKFILISTDKAVNPTNIMGASKRICEMIVQMMNRQCEHTDFVAVRFGNVLGSNGSVIPLFKKQIAAGGPVTVTDKNIIRYFMTIPEAVSLVLQASYYAKGGEIFVLDMGDPVRIDDMARNLIRLSGYVPDVDIRIEYTGLRPGEKMYEELLMDEEGLTKTENALIYIGHPIDMDDASFREMLKELDKASKQETDKVRMLVAKVVPTYHYEKKGA